MKMIVMVGGFIVGCAMNDARALLEMSGCFVRQVALAIENVAFGVYVMSFWIS